MCLCVRERCSETTKEKERDCCCMAGRRKRVTLLTRSHSLLLTLRCCPPDPNLLPPDTATIPRFCPRERRLCLAAAVGMRRWRSPTRGITPSALISRLLLIAMRRITWPRLRTTPSQRRCRSSRPRERSSCALATSLRLTSSLTCVWRRRIWERGWAGRRLEKDVVVARLLWSEHVQQRF